MWLCNNIQMGLGCFLEVKLKASLMVSSEWKKNTKGSDTYEVVVGRCLIQLESLKKPYLWSRRSTMDPLFKKKIEFEFKFYK